MKKKEDVDLGYTDVSGGKTAKELLQEAKQTEAEEPKAEPKFEQVEEKEEDTGLQDYSDKVQKKNKKINLSS